MLNRFLRDPLGDDSHQIELGALRFAVHSSLTRHKCFPYSALLPFVLFFAALLAGLLLKPIVVRDLANVWSNPIYFFVALVDIKHDSQKAIEHLLTKGVVPQKSSLPTLHLYVDANVLSKMQEALIVGDPSLGHDPGGDRPYFKAVLVDEYAKVQKVSIAYRGKSTWHHQSEKPSFRIKLRKSDVVDGVRYMELHRPEDVLALKNWLPQKLAAEFGLMSDQARHLRLFINRRFFGVYVCAARPGEPLAVKCGKMPGPFFKDDNESELWSTTDHWAIHGDATPADLEHLSQFLGTLDGETSVETLETFWKHLDFGDYAKWSALMIVCGGAHSDGVHNHVFFLDSTHGRLETLPWDVHGYGMLAVSKTPPDLVLHPVMGLATRDPHWVHRRNQYLYELLSGLASKKRQLEIVDDAVTALLPDLRADPRLIEVEAKFTGWEGVAYSALDIDDKQNELKAWIEQRCDFLEYYLSDADVYVEPDLLHEGRSIVTVSGRVAVRMTNSSRVSETDPIPDAATLLYPGLSEKLHRFYARTHEMAPDLGYAKPAALKYHVLGSPNDLSFVNAITGEPVVPKIPPLVNVEPSRTIHPALFSSKPTDDVVLGPGVVELHKDVHVAETQRLIIPGGTTLRLAGGIGIYSRGVVSVEGEANSPVVIEPLGEKPWAAFGISGPGADGSTFRYMKVHGGSLGRDGGVRFKGMFNLYHCGEVTLDHCEFGRNLNSDDAVNIVKSNATVRNCIWRNANADGLDMDMSSGVVDRCKFIASGNDGLDLMTCQVRVLDCEFFDSNDKGISIGEKTSVLVENCDIAGCEIGIEVKDASRALVRNCLFSENRVAVHCYQKKWLYGRGGSLAMADCTIRDTAGSDFWIEKRSEVVLKGTELGPVCEGRGRIETVDELAKEWIEFTDFVGIH